MKLNILQCRLVRLNHWAHDSKIIGSNPITAIYCLYKSSDALREGFLVKPD